MTWIQPYNAAFEKPVMRQLAAIIWRDQAAAITAVGRTELFAELQLANVPPRAWPALLIVPEINRFDPEAMHTRRQWADFHCVATVTHQDPHALLELTMDYARAVHYLLDGIPLSDWHVALALPAPPFPTGTTTQLNIAEVTVSRIFVGQHAYGEALRGRQMGLFGMAVDVPCRIEFEEA